MINWNLKHFLTMSAEAKLLYVYLKDQGLRVDRAIRLDEDFVSNLIGERWLGFLQELRNGDLIRVAKKEDGYKVVSTVDDTTGLSILLKDGSFFEIDDELINEFRSCYPGADVIPVLMRCVRWNADPKHAQQRKTRKGVVSHIHKFFRSPGDGVFAKKNSTDGKDHVVSMIANNKSEAINNIKSILSSKQAG